MNEIQLPPQIHVSWNEAIDRGMKTMDDHFGSPEWVAKIDLEALDLSLSTSCVCGQLFEMEAKEWGKQKDISSSYSTGYEWALQYIMEDEADAAANGFMLTDPGYLTILILKYNGLTYSDAVERFKFKEAWGMFTDMWIERIEKRRAELGLM